MIKFLNLVSLWILPIILLIVLTVALAKKIPVYEQFTEGAKDGFKISIKIIPYLVAIIVGISMFRASGAVDILGKFLNPVFETFKIPPQTLMVMITRSLSGSATLGVLGDIINQTGVDSYATKLAAIITGSSETTFYVASVYFGAVGIKKFRYALLSGIMADITGLIAAIYIASIFFL